MQQHVLYPLTDFSSVDVAIDRPHGLKATSHFDTQRWLWNFRTQLVRKSDIRKWISCKLGFLCLYGKDVLVNLTLSRTTFLQQKKRCCAIQGSRLHLRFIKLKQDGQKSYVLCCFPLNNIVYHKIIKTRLRLWQICCQYQNLVGIFRQNFLESTSQQEKIAVSKLFQLCF